MKTKVIILLLISTVVTLSFTFASHKHIQKPKQITTVTENVGGLASEDPIK